MTGSPAAEAPEGAPIPTHGPTCPRRQWFAWRQREPAAGGPGAPGDAERPPAPRWPCWRRWGGPEGEGPDGQQMPRWMRWRRPADESGDWPPKGAQEWREQWSKRCPWRASGCRPYTAARVPLDDSRWLEDFYDWH
ncbi:hypothetical protein R5R35_010299 [Gryllus longicercus]|uniref:Uncharacterized protein n=1 Tax=Gryllus longicercus TaxID=2509291 RepID=A0AAN9VP99_9ORTH